MQQSNGHHHLPPGTYSVSNNVSIVRMPSDTSDDDHSFRNIFPTECRKIVSVDKTERWSLQTSVAEHATNGVIKMTQIERYEVWDFRICGYTFVAGKSNRVNTFKNSAGEVLRKTVDYLKPLGKIVTEEEAKRMIKEFQALAVASEANNGNIPHDGHRNNGDVGQGVGLGGTPPIPRPPVSRTRRGAHNFTGGAGIGVGGAGRGAGGAGRDAGGAGRGAGGAGSGYGGAGSGAGASLLASASSSSAATIERSSPRYEPLSSPESSSNVSRSNWQLAHSRHHVSPS